MIIDWQHHYFPEPLWRKLGGKPGKVGQVLQGGAPGLSLFDTITVRISRFAIWTIAAGPFHDG